eukprot:GDKJ01025623.1.p2 GENE.GDKJ01025623.1~~GDKJ01025623.1.p2  ORF type:complete len:128 (-),score=5.87 GDKJ01025623.1:47-430(-)
MLIYPHPPHGTEPMGLLGALVDWHDAKERGYAREYLGGCQLQLLWRGFSRHAIVILWRFTHAIAAAVLFSTSAKVLDVINAEVFTDLPVEPKRRELAARHTLKLVDCHLISQTSELNRPKPEGSAWA